MSEPIEQPKRPPTEEDFIRYGGRVGAAIAFWMSLIPLCLLLLLSDGIHAKDIISLIMEIIGSIIVGVLISIGPVLLLSAGGYSLGKMAAKCASVNSAILLGTIVFSLIALVVFTPFFIWIHEVRLTRSDLLFFFLLYAILVAFFSLISSIAAIYVRDYRQFQRKRWIPQFTLQEMFIVFFLLSVIISALSSIPVLPL